MQTVGPMTLELLYAVAKRIRDFDAGRYLDAKLTLINKFFKEQNLDSCVMGMSGGVDSATVLSLLNAASKLSDSPIKRILPLILPIYGNGTTGQDLGQELAERQIKALGLDYKVVDLTPAYKAYLQDGSNAWSNGQLASTIRMPCFYYHAALLQQGGFKSIVVGTTNKDEGSYIGFFGKTSDAMVDLQIISDIHKSEVYEIAALLKVLPEIINRPPTGDVWNGQTTEEMMGAPYWFLELYLILKQMPALLDEWLPNMPNSELKLFKHYSTNIEALHNKNKHKYEVSMPSFFIDYMPRTGIPGGW